MSINEQHKYHGVASLYLWEALSEQLPEAHFHLGTGSSNSSYLLTGLVPHTLGKGRSVQAGLFIKYSRKVLTPWRYSFKLEHQDEIQKLKDKYGQVFIAFVNGDDGIACVDFENLKIILDEHHEEQEWVSVSRKPRQNYRIAGNDGTHEKPLPMNSYPQIVVEFFREQLKL